MLKKPWLVLLVFQTSDLFFTANQTALFGGKRQVFAFYHTMILHMHVHGIYINILSHHDFAYARTRYIHKHFCLWWFNQGKKYENSNTLKRNYRTVVGVALSVCSDHLMPFKDSHLMQRTFFFFFLADNPNIFQSSAAWAGADLIPLHRLPSKQAMALYWVKSQMYSQTSGTE